MKVAGKSLSLQDKASMVKLKVRVFNSSRIENLYSAYAVATTTAKASYNALKTIGEKEKPEPPTPYPQVCKKRQNKLGPEATARKTSKTSTTDLPQLSHAVVKFESSPLELLSVTSSGLAETEELADVASDMEGPGHICGAASSDSPTDLGASAPYDFQPKFSCSGGHVFGTWVASRSWVPESLFCPLPEAENFFGL